LKNEFYTQKKREGKLRSPRGYSDSKEHPDEEHDDNTRTAGFNLNELRINEVRSMLINDGIAKKVLGLIGEGKEANVYWIEDLEGNYLAAKMFRMYRTAHKAAFARHRAHTTDRLGIAAGLCLREYQNLTYMYDGKVLVPKPVHRHEFFYLMEFLGDENGPSPLLSGVNLNELGIDPVSILDQLLDELDTMFNTAQMVHGDFSEHNIVWHDSKPWIIDVFQSQRYHPRYDTVARIKKNRALKVLKRDITNLIGYFTQRYRVGYNVDEVFSIMVEDPVEDWIPDTLMGENFDLNAYIRQEKKVYFS
jgi:RIO kinase 1